jgi:hypothetical protein
MRPSARFLVAGLVTVMALVAAYAAVFLAQLGAPVAAEYWVPEAEIVKADAAERQRGRRIVILGGSNALFGLDSAAIESATRRPTVNLGLHGGLSLDYMLGHASPLFRPGDIVILSLEYSYFESANPSPSWFTSNVMAWAPRYFWRLSPRDKLEFAWSTPAKRVLNGALAALFGTRLRERRGRVVRAPAAVLEEAGAIRQAGGGSAKPALYSFQNMSERGDIQGTDGSFYTDDLDTLPAPVFKSSHEAWERLRRFQSECRRRGIRVFLSWPALPAQFGRNEPAVRRYLKAIQTEAARLGLPALGDPADYLLDQRYFFNTIYHLNQEGRAVRTARVLDRLRPEL